MESRRKVIWSVCLVWVVCATWLGMGEVSAASHAKRQVWYAKKERATFVRGQDKVWRSYHGKKLSPHVFHEFERTMDYVALYDLKRHLAIRLYRGFYLVRWSFRRGLPMWVMMSRGGWVDLFSRRKVPGKRARPPKRRVAPSVVKNRLAAARPAPIKRAVGVVRPSSRPSSRPASRPTSRSVARRKAPQKKRAIARKQPAPRKRPAARRKNAGYRSIKGAPLPRIATPMRTRLATLLSLRGLPPIPKTERRRLQKQFSWTTVGGKRFQHVVGRLWRVYRKGQPSHWRYLEVKRAPHGVLLFSPQRKLWVKLMAQAYLIKRKEGDWLRVSSGSWKQSRIDTRHTWISRRKRTRLQHIRGGVWGIFRRGKWSRTLFLQVEKNQTFIDLVSKGALRLRLYGSRVFMKRLRKGARWRRLGNGAWDDNPSQISLDRATRRAVAALLKGKKAAPVRRAVARRSVARRQPPTRRASPKPSARRTIAMRRAVPRKRPAARRIASRRVVSKRRDTRVKVTTPKTTPWRSIAFLRIKKRNGRKSFATGVLIGPRLLLTSGHAIYDRKSKKTASTLWIYPGLFSRKMTYGATYPVRWAVHPRWIGAKKDKDAIQHDLAIVRLKKPLGKKAGWLPLATALPGLTRGASMMLAGYPLDKFFKTKNLWMWHETRRGHAVASKGYPWSDRILTYHRMAPGMAGAPLLYKMGGRWRVVGIARRRLGRKADFVRLNPANIAWIRRTIQRWKARSRPTATPFDGGDDPPSQARFWEGDGVDLDQLAKEK